MDLKALKKDNCDLPDDGDVVVVGDDEPHAGGRKDHATRLMRENRNKKRLPTGGTYLLRRPNWAVPLLSL